MKMTKDEKMVLYTSDQSATYRTGLEGWVSRHGNFFGKDEHLARYHGSTHKNCDECGELIDKMGYCSPCRDKRLDQRYLEMECRQWDGNAALYSDTNDKYFFDIESVHDYVEEIEGSMEGLHLIICDPISLSTITSDVWCDELPQDGDLPHEVCVAIDKLNAVIMEQRPVSWYPSKYAVNLTCIDSRWGK